MTNFLWQSSSFCGAIAENQIMPAVPFACRLLQRHKVFVFHSSLSSMLQLWLHDGLLS